MSRSRLPLLALAVVIAIPSTSLLVGLLAQGAWVALVCPALTFAAVAILVREARRMPEGSMLAIPVAARRRGVLAVVAAFALVGLSWLVTEPIFTTFGYDGGGDGAQAVGRGSYTITYQSPEGVDVRVTVDVPSMTCRDTGDMRHYEDASTPDGARPGPEFKVTASRVSAAGRRFAVVTLPFDEAMVFESTEPIDADADGFRFSGLAGLVTAVDAAPGEGVVAATAEGAGEC